MDDRDTTKQAILFYINYIDLDFMDYSDTIENDIDYIKDLIKKHGATEAKKILDNIMGV